MHSLWRALRRNNFFFFLDKKMKNSHVNLSQELRCWSGDRRDMWVSIEGRFNPTDSGKNKRQVGTKKVHTSLRGEKSTLKCHQEEDLIWAFISHYLWDFEHFTFTFRFLINVAYLPWYHAGWLWKMKWDIDHENALSAGMYYTYVGAPSSLPHSDMSET